MIMLCISETTTINIIGIRRLMNILPKKPFILKFYARALNIFYQSPTVFSNF